MLFYEAPHKLLATLKDMLKTFGDRVIALVRELTKIHEEFIRDNVSNILERIEEVKGEFVILIEGNSESKKDIELADLKSKSLEEHYEVYAAQGFEKKEIIKKIAKDRNLTKNEIYQYFLYK